MCKAVRELDRKIHGMKYFPKLFYPEMYVLNGGYRSFYSQYSELCEPNGYIAMKDPKFLDVQKHCWKVWKTTKKELSRSRSLSDLRTKSPDFNLTPPTLSPKISTYPPPSSSTPSSKRPLVNSFSTPHFQDPKILPNFYNIRLTECQKEELSVSQNK
jgi:hypothetical protein